MLLLPITMAVMGVSLLITVVPLMYEHFKDIPHYDYLIQGGVMTMPAIWVVLFSPLAGLLADRFGRRSILMGSDDRVCRHRRGNLRFSIICTPSSSPASALAFASRSS